jgi:hypothetical protein
MASEQIIIDYKVEVAGMRAQLKAVEDGMKKVEATSKQSAQTVKKEFQSSADSIKQGATQIAGALGIAFGVHKIIEFGKESVKAFTEAEENANKLKFAVQKIGGEGTLAFKKLIEQSEKLQKSTIFSDDSIQQAQTALATFGLTSDQIEALIPKIADMASATGTDLVSATQKAIQGINGQTRGLKEVGIQFADTGSKTENLAVLTDKLSKFQGASADALETTVGKAKRLENAFGDIQEKIGEYLVNEGVAILDNFEAVFGDKNLVFVRQQNEKLNKINEETNAKTLKKAQESEANRLEAIKKTEKAIQNLKQVGLALQDVNAQKLTYNQLQNEQKLLTELSNLNEKQVIEDDKTLGAAKLEASEDLSKKLRDLETANIRLTYDRKKQEILNNFADEEQKYAGHLDILNQLAIQKGNALTDLYNEREKEYEKIRKEGADKSVEIFKKSSDEMKAEDTSFSKTVMANQDAIIEKVKVTAEERKAIEQELYSFLSTTLSGIAQINTNISDKRIQETQEVNDAETYELQKQLDAKLITQEQYDQKKAELDKRSAEKEKEIKRRTFEANKQIMLIQTIMATAQATIAALGSIPYTTANIALAALTAAAGAVQIAVITSQPTPKFAKGGKVDGRLHSQGGTLIEAERDEMIINRNDAMKNDKLLGAINSGKGQQFIFDHYIAPALKAQQQKNAENKEKSFASNLANSMGLNFKDGNLLDSMKQTRKNDKEIALYLGKKIEGSQRSNHKW